ncbi:MBL fold metallo-hydrolase [candidate division KSB3 bacterium]|uniref:MBL fold metallo-hydrolase n=1 Tax=candidate division KSB3 bacterium TaxID=2044937 RepID=A0A2G6KFS0_9BACT|nr:MAG: MBL fold metallo-hydrolase [candidate division KSB3 bacterium]
MFVKQFLTGGDRNFGYLAAEEATQKAVIIDPSYSPTKLADFAAEHGYAVEYVFNTHGHYDHTNGNAEIERLTGKTPLLYGDIEPQTGMKVVHDANFPLGDLTIRIIHTPGHTQDSICLYLGDAVFTGDTLFVGKIGGTDFGAQARNEYDSLHQHILILPDDTRVFPGHNYGTAPESTIKNERETNPFLIQPDFEAFVDLKRNWTAYKLAHGIQ